MKLAFLVYYVILAFIVDENVYSSVDVVHPRKTLIELDNACTGEEEYFVSCIIRHGDVVVYKSPILGSTDQSGFLYPNTTTDLSITIFKHMKTVDPGTVIITKKLEPGHYCFLVTGIYSTPKLLNCLKEIICQGYNECEEGLSLRGSYRTKDCNRTIDKATP